MRLVGFDSETYLIGPDAVVPRMVCASFAELGKPPLLLATADAELEPTLRALLEDQDVVIVAHNAAFDACVAMRRYPEHEALWWAALAAGRVICTMVREMLLDLSTAGSLEFVKAPDGSELPADYSLAALALRYLSVDMADEKGEDGWQLRFGTLDGMPAREYPADARAYAEQDAVAALGLYLRQDERKQSETGHASCSLAPVQTAAAAALLRITARGMPVDETEFRRVEHWLATELAPARMAPLYATGILSRPIAARPYVNCDMRARDLAAEWLGILPEDVDWERVDEPLKQSLADAGMRMKAPEPEHVSKAALAARILAVTIAQAKGEQVSKWASRPLDDLMRQAKEDAIPFRRTSGGAVCAKEEITATLAPLDERHDPSHEETPLGCYRRRQKLQKLVTTELPRMRWAGVPAKVVHFPYKILVETGRTSSYATDKYPSANGQNVDPRARPMFLPRPGYVLCSADYSTLELACVAQVTYELFGESVHRDKLVAGYDLHAYLGARLSAELDPRGPLAGIDGADERYLAFKALEQADKPYYKRWRKLAKPVGLGFPGGLGPQKLVGLARQPQYSVDLVAVARERYEANPDEFQADRITLFYAKRLHRMEEKDFRWTPMLLAVNLAARLRQVWLETYPEMPRYFEWVKAQVDERNPALQVKDDESGEFREVAGLCYTTPLGMHRAAATYTAAANGRAMQSPAAEGFKLACFDLVRACCDPASTSPLRGKAHVVNQVHDEFILELPEAEAPELALEVRRIMEAGMATVLTDVPVKASPCLMRRWRKEAEPVYDERGRLMVWEPAAA